MNKIILFPFLSCTWEQFYLDNIARPAIRDVSVMDFGLTTDLRREKTPLYMHVCNFIHFAHRSTLINLKYIVYFEFS